MADENNIQALVHAIEEGGWVKWLKLAMILAVTFAIGLILLSKFRGLADPRAMELAEISREVSRGHGLSTLMIRPVEIPRLMTAHAGAFPGARVPETYHPPLFPVVMAPFLLLNGPDWTISSRASVPKQDKIVAGAGIVLFLLAVGANFFLVRRMFDARLAGLTCGLLLISDPLWQYAMSGLPQMLMLLLFTGALYGLVRAVEPETTHITTWVAVMSAFFGLLALTHGLTIWCFVGAMVFVLIYLPRRWANLGAMFGIFLLFYAPWLVRNYLAIQNPFGVSVYSILHQIIGRESDFMRHYAINLPEVTMSGFRVKVIAQFSEFQMGRLYQNLGFSVPAMAFFFALLHRFREKETRALQWGLALVWIVALVGMCLFGFVDQGLQPNNLHLLFIPAFTAFGLAFLLMLWNRLEIPGTLFRNAFVIVVYFLSGAPLISSLTAPPAVPVQWPPYIPAVIGALNGWFQPTDIIASDMPWAVAWYADRRSLWLPETPALFTEIHDFNQLGGDLNGLFLTPITGNEPFIGEIARGNWKDWAPFIMRTQNVKGFPLKSMLPLIEGQIVFYSDRERWSATP